MLIINFSHPLTESQLKKIEEITGEKVVEIKNIQTQFDNEKPYHEQIEDLVKRCGLTPEEWGKLPILIVPPALNFIAVSLLAAIHGLTGYFPSVVRLKPVGAIRRFEVAEIINLGEIRERFRTLRFNTPFD